MGRGVLEELDAYVENFPSVEVTLPWGESDSKKVETVKVVMTNDKRGLYTRQAFNAVVWRPAFVRAGVEYLADRDDGMRALRHLYASWIVYKPRKPQSTKDSESGTA